MHGRCNIIERLACNPGAKHSQQPFQLLLAASGITLSFTLESYSLTPVTEAVKCCSSVQPDSESKGST